MDDIWKMVEGGMTTGELLVIAGRSGVGKTRFTEQMLLEIAHERNLPVAFLNYEVNESDFTSKLQER